MAHTNSTPNYGLPQFIGDDKPTFLGDMNGAFSDIDTAMKANAVSAQEANAGVATNASAISGLQTAEGALETRVETVEGVAAGNTGNINTINSLIGNGEPTTTDKTLIGAINELNAGETTLAGRITTLENSLPSNHAIATATADGTKTFADLITELETAYNALANKPSVNVMYITYGQIIFKCITSSGALIFNGMLAGSTNVQTYQINLSNHTFTHNTIDTNGFATEDLSVATANAHLVLLYVK